MSTKDSDRATTAVATTTTTTLKFMFSVANTIYEQQR